MDESVESNSTLSEFDEEEHYKDQVFFCEYIRDLSSKLQSLEKGNIDALRKSIDQYASQISLANESLLQLARINCPLSESLRYQLDEAAKAEALQYAARIQNDTSSASEGPGDDCEGGRARAMTNVGDTDIDTLSVTHATSDSATSSATSTSSLGIEQRQERESGSTDNNPRPRQRRKVNNSSSGVTSTASVPFDEARIREAAMAETQALAGKFDTVNFGQDEAQPLAMETSIVTICRLKLAEVISRGQLSVVRSILDQFCCSMKGTDMCREELIGMEEKTIAILQRVPNYSDAIQSRGDFLSSLSRTAKVDFSFAISEAHERLASVRAIKAALGKDRRGNDRTLNASVLREYSVASHAVKNLLQILANISSAVDVLSEFTVEEIFSRSDEFKRLSAELYRELFSSDLDGANFSALQLIIEVVVPFLKKNAPADRIRAVKLALAICEQSLNTNDGRINLILRKFRAAASQSMESGGGIVQSTTDYFSCSNRRREAMICFHGLIMADVIDAKTPDSILEHGGFALRALGLSWSDLTRCCRRVVNADFFGTSSEDSFRTLCSEEDSKRLPKNAAKEIKTKVVIYNRKQMDSLQALARFEDL